MSTTTNASQSISSKTPSTSPTILTLSGTWKYQEVSCSHQWLEALQKVCDHQQIRFLSRFPLGQSFRVGRGGGGGGARVDMVPYSSSSSSFEQRKEGLRPVRETVAPYFTTDLLISTGERPLCPRPMTGYRVTTFVSSHFRNGCVFRHLVTRCKEEDEVVWAQEEKEEGLGGGAPRSRRRSPRRRMVMGSYVEEDCQEGELMALVEMRVVLLEGFPTKGPDGARKVRIDRFDGSNITTVEQCLRRGGGGGGGMVIAEAAEDSLEKLEKSGGKRRQAESNQTDVQEATETPPINVLRIKTRATDCDGLGHTTVTRYMTFLLESIDETLRKVSTTGGLSSQHGSPEEVESADQSAINRISRLRYSVHSETFSQTALDLVVTAPEPGVQEGGVPRQTSSGFRVQAFRAKSPSSRGGGARPVVTGFVTLKDQASAVAKQEEEIKLKPFAPSPSGRLWRHITRKKVQPTLDRKPGRETVRVRAYHSEKVPAHNE
ncbi:hypothetical protein IE53DRAFT_372079 [Violaceomyces palustris]|uniref:Uncharacterized protein n=1 Tax=Violaceomyces palustris TaxID=1673888 RepID=A0ACD0NLS9_9BASI|nr:hypothetical protein IE53DRAFT_372079 [Violaceomyces palustris]